MCKFEPVDAKRSSLLSSQQTQLTIYDARVSTNLKFFYAHSKKCFFMRAFFDAKTKAKERNAIESNLFRIK